MPRSSTDEATITEDDTPETKPPADAEVVADVLVEDVSIDGMCGVY